MPTVRDFRKLPASTQAELRRVAVNMVLSGTSRIEVAKAIGVNRRFVGEWVRAFEDMGETALAGGRRGRRPGEQKALNRRQEAMIRRLIVDNLRVHRARTVTAWVEENKDRIELFYLPPYAPERNPDEYVNNDVKQGVGRRSTPMDKAAMKAGLTAHMRGLQSRPHKVRSFFQAPDIRYAA
jgi:DDE superfamily endonuclease/Helix-turn-helix domain